MRHVVALVLVLVALAAPAAAAATRPLHVERGAEAAIVDDRDREVLLRGVNVNQLGDYYAANPALPTVVPLREADFARIAALGFNVVRLVVSWSALEPARGAFDHAYVARVRRAVRWAAKHDLAIVLDMHQDSWGKHIATPPDVECPPGLGPAVGWDGAPEWATFTDGLTTCRAANARELSPAVAQAFTSFYADRDGIQSELVATWGRVAAALAPEPNVAGYDLLNEPHPGWAVGADQSALLGRFYARAIDAIRASERRAGAPRRWSSSSRASPGRGSGPTRCPSPASRATRTSCSRRTCTSSRSRWIAAPASGRSRSEQGFDLAQRAAALYGAPLWSGEWGWFGDPGESRSRLERYAAQEDARALGGAWWVWRQACGDPHVVGYPGASGSLNPLECPSGRQLALVTGYTDVLRRAYPRAAPGRLRRLVSDHAGGRWEVHGHDADRAGSCRTDVWVPARDPWLRGENVSRLRVRRVPGGFRAAGCARGEYALHGRPASTVERACRSRRRVRVALDAPPGVRLRDIVVRVAGRPVRRLRYHRRAVVVGLPGRPGARQRVGIDARGSDGRSHGWARSYRLCRRSRGQR